ncbi:MAG TPA: methylated-DNA--[protein]-cysteine S-methyltransferase [Mycobacteriales bacterium]|nr:methylated-DNA--[protein]-cysteine S-methyltransferase [Mycobacteriales bacterium]
MSDPAGPRRTHTVLDSPIGPLTLLATDDALTGLHLLERRHPPDPERFGEPDPTRFTEAADQLRAYFAGHLTEFDLPLAPAGTPFQQRVWAELRAIPYGRTASYGQIAAQLGKPTAARAVGAANGRNPISIIVPCHRLVSSTGGLISYGGGLERKAWLLAHERRTGTAV